MHDEPLALHLAIDIRYAHRQVQRVAIAHAAADALDAVPVAEAARGADVEVGQLDGNGAIKERQEVFPIPFYEQRTSDRRTEAPGEGTLSTRPRGKRAAKEGRN